MYRKSHIGIILCIFCVFCDKAICFGENGRTLHDIEDRYCKNIGITEGLSQSSVTSITYDKYGSLWIGTRYGLNEYRNRHMRQIHDSGQEGLMGDYIHLLFIDQTDTLWVSTEEGISKYSYTEDRFFKVTDAQAYSSYQDSTGIYFGTDKGIIHYHDGRIINHQFKNAYINGIYPYEDKLLLVDKGLGLWLFDGYIYTKVDYQEIDTAVIMSSAIKDDKLYLSLYRKGLCIIDLQTDEIKSYDTTNSGLSFDVILTMMVTEDEIWMGTDGGGINIYSVIDDSIRQFDLPSSSITTLYRDPYSNIWAGSVRSGLYGIKSSRVISFDSISGGLTNDVVISLAEGSSNRIWIGTDGGGINVYDVNTGSITPINDSGSAKVSSIVELPGEKLLVSSYSQGLHILDTKSQTSKTFTLVDPATNARECFYGNTPLIYKVDNYRYLITAIDVYEYDHRDGSFIKFTSKDGSPTSELRIFNRDMDICYAHSPEGIFKLDCNSHTITRVHVNTEGQTISSAAYSYPLIWIGTSDGLYTYDITNKTTKRTTTPLLKRITYLQTDISGSLWIAADNTLFRKTQDRTEIIGENEGFATNEILTGLEVGQYDKNMILLGGTNGFVKIDTEDHVSDDNISKGIILHNVSIGGKRTKIIQNKVKLPSESSSIRISVVLSPADPFSRYMYRYHIDGKSSYSIETYDDFLLLPDLKEGQYNLKVSYLRNDGIWSDPVEILHMKVLPPWYRSILFNITCLLIFMFLSYKAIIRLYRKKVQKMEMRIRAENDDFLKKLDTYITANLDNPHLDIPSIALHMAMSRASLYSRVKKILGKGVGQHIDDLRIKEACRLLENENISIGDISDRLGYSSARYFSTRFKQQIGLTPREYRTKQQSKNNF